MGLAGDGGSAFHGRLDPAQAGGVVDDPDRSAYVVGTLGSSAHVEGHDCTEPVHEAAGRLVRRMIRPPGVTHDLHAGVAGEAVGQVGGRRAGLAKSHRQGAHPSDGEIGLEGTGGRSGQLPSRPQLLGVLVGGRDHGPEQQVGVAAEVFRGRVHDKVRPQLERPLE
jgi:hypothetical protein